MKRDRVRRRRCVVLDGVQAFERRVLMSTFGRSIPTPPAHVRPFDPENGPLLHGEKTRARPALHVANHSSSFPVRPTAQRWSWLAGTYWYVPVANLPATLFDASSGKSTLVSDQTVFHITGYNNGYFTGDVVTQLGSSTPSNSTMVGSVTPEGRVLLSFTSTGSGSSPSVTQGYGVMTRRFGQWAMENQMFTSPNETLQIGHWAYMLQTRPGMPTWRSLPSVGESVPEFLSQ